MNALNESARIVNDAWCQGDLRKEQQSADEGDTYCAVGAMVHAFSQSIGLNIDWDIDIIGTQDSIEEFKKYQAKAAADRMNFWEEWKNSEQSGFPEYPEYKNYKDFGLSGSYDFIGKTGEGRMLAETIITNYPERVRFSSIANMEAWLEGFKDEPDEQADVISTVIVAFNDHGDTTREDVVAMMEKAAVAYDDKVAFEDKTSDDLVNEIDEMLNA